MNSKRNLLETKRMLALSLAGVFTMTLAACGNEYSNQRETEETHIITEREIKDQRRQLLAIYNDRAIIIEPLTSDFYNSGSYYEVNLSNDNRPELYVPMSEFILFTSRSPISAEEYVALACGPEFPIEYIRHEDYRSR